MNIGIIGLGYVGITTLAAFAKLGMSICGIDTNKSKLDALRSGNIPLSEPNVNSILKSNRDNITYRSALDETVDQFNCIMICVGTPSNNLTGETDISALLNVVGELANLCTLKTPIVIRSTIPIGTTRQLKEMYPHLRLLFQPEFLREGSAVDDFFNAPKIVFGTNDDDREIAETLCDRMYNSLICQRFFVSYETAESVKYVDNLFHALKVVFTNEISSVITGKQGDPSEVLKIFRADEKLNISPLYLKPGFAYGGSCLEKDLLSFRHQASDVEIPLISAISESNAKLVQKFAEKIVGKAEIFVFNGIAFKEHTDDLRRSPFVSVAEYLLKAGKTVYCFDDNVAGCFGESREILSRLLSYENCYLNTEFPSDSNDFILIKCHKNFSNLCPKIGPVEFDIFVGGDVRQVYA